MATFIVVQRLDTGKAYWQKETAAAPNVSAQIGSSFPTAAAATDDASKRQKDPRSGQAVFAVVQTA